MTDIVERLRHEVEVFYGKPPCSLLNEAADEIERLRGALKKIAKLKISPDDNVNGHILIIAKVMARVAVGEKE